MNSELHIRLISTSDYECDFVLEDCTPAMANMLRKACMSHVPTLAIDTIDFIKNTSVIIDEQITQRLSYIPIVSTVVDNYVIYNECTCDKDCEKCSISFEIDVSNTTNSIVEVSSHDIKINHPDVSVFFDTKYGIPITRLTPGQVCIIRGKIKKGTGKHHSKWSPVGTSSYKFLPQFSFKRKLVQEEKEKLVKICPMNVFKQVSDIEDLQLSVEKCTVCMECTNEFPNLIDMKFKTDSAVFKVESVGQLEVDMIIKKAVQIVQS